MIIITSMCVITMKKNNCSILRWLWPALATLVEDLCDTHDTLYRYRVATRAEADADFAVGVDERLRRVWGWSTRAVVVSLIIYLALRAGGWWLWYDFDKKLERLWK